MKKVKGCINGTCAASQKKIIYKEEENYCPKCGNKLYYVCKKCYTQLPNDSEKYCVRCLADRQDHKDYTMKIAGSVVATVGVAAISIGKQVIKAISKAK